MTDTPSEAAPSADWNKIVAESGQDSTPTTPTAPTAAAGYGTVRTITLPELPFVVGRLPITCDTKTAVLQLPEPIKGVHCAAVLANVTVLSDCDRPADDVCRPAPKYARPLNDREIEVVLWGGGTQRAVGTGWKTSTYGGQLETRPVPIGVPVVEVQILAGRAVTCGCDSEQWVTDEGWG